MGDWWVDVLSHPYPHLPRLQYTCVPSTAGRPPPLLHPPLLPGAQCWFGTPGYLGRTVHLPGTFTWGRKSTFVTPGLPLCRLIVKGTRSP